MTCKRILSDQQIDEMARLRESNWGYDRIAAHFAAAGTPVSRGSIRWQCLRVGADVPQRHWRCDRAPEQPYQRGRHLVRPFTVQEDARLIALERAGTSIASIARELDRKANSIRGRLYTLARHDTRLEAML